PDRLLAGTRLRLPHRRGVRADGQRDPALRAPAGRGRPVPARTTSRCSPRVRLPDAQADRRRSRSAGARAGPRGRARRAAARARDRARARARRGTAGGDAAAQALALQRRADDLRAFVRRDRREDGALRPPPRRARGRARVPGEARAALQSLAREVSAHLLPLRAPLAGTVVSLDVAVGEEVQRGQPVVVLEAMKLEHVLEAPESGIVRELAVAVGDLVAEDQPLAFLEPAAISSDARS